MHASAYRHEVLQGLCLVPLVDAPLDGDTTLRRATNVVCFMPLPMGFLPAELDLAFEGIDALTSRLYIAAGTSTPTQHATKPKGTSSDPVVCSSGGLSTNETSSPAHLPGRRRTGGLNFK